MLWKKESNKKDALYIDLLALCETDLESDINQIISIKGSKPIPQKSEAIAMQLRRDGNAVYGVHAYSHAMELYSESLLYSESGSENISLAYANRSTCFLKLNMLDECLKDIELAKAAGYPIKLMHKLDERRVTCLKRISEGVQPLVIDAKLSFKHDKKMPCMANVLKVKRDNMGNYSVVAKEDIDVDQTIVMEKSFRTHLTKRFGFKCNICLKGYTNLVPCTKCAVAMFCEGCQNHFLHEFECGLNICGPSALNNDIMFEVRIALMAIELFPSVDELIEFVEQSLKSGANGLPDSLENAHAEFRAFFLLALQESSDVTYSDELVIWIYAVYKTILKIPQINAKFQTQKHLRFLMHLIWHQSSTSTNTEHFFRYTERTANEEFDNPICFSKQVYLMDGYFEHSCAPNILAIAGDGKNAYITTKPIKRGERVNISYLPIYIDPNAVRQQLLRNNTNITCNCARCQGIIATSTERQHLINDPSYRSLVTSEHRISSLLATNEEIREMIEYCVIVLKQHGRMKWCDEIKKVFTMYQALLHIRMVGFTPPRIDDPDFLQSQLREIMNISNN